jgi:cysteine desulfurase
MTPPSNYYFDYAAATPLSEAAMAAMQPYLSEQFYNPSADYAPARKVKQALEDARREVAHIIGAKPVEIVFAAGGTEANNIAIHGVMQQYPEANMVISAVEHDSVRRPAGQYSHKICPVNEQGVVNLEKLKSSINSHTVLVSVMLANNEIGTIQPLKEVASLISGIKRQRQQDDNELPLLLHTDAAQAGNYLDLHVHRLGVDLMTVNGGKLYGPKQSGMLFIRSGVQLQPFIHGGGQERGLRSGTEHVAASVGFARALADAQSQRTSESVRMQSLQRIFIDELISQVPKVVVNGSRKSRLPNNVHITLPGQDNERLLILLDQHGIFAAVGSACSASHDEPSHVLAAIGKSTQEIRGSLRFSMGRTTDEAAVKYAAATLASLVS